MAIYQLIRTQTPGPQGVATLLCEVKASEKFTQRHEAILCGLLRDAVEQLSQSDEETFELELRRRLLEELHEHE